MGNLGKAQRNREIDCIGGDENFMSKEVKKASDVGNGGFD